MPWFRKWVAPCLAALALVASSPTLTPAQTFLGRGLGLKHCFYRVYFRPCCDKPWQCYATYTDWDLAQETVGYLQLMGCDAYAR